MTPPWFAAAQVGGGGFGFLPLISLLITIVIAVWIYRDAKRRNSGHALAWAVAALFASLLILILYWVVRDEVGTGRRA